MQLAAYRHTEAGYRLKPEAAPEAAVTTDDMMRVREAERIRVANHNLFLRQKREADKAIRRANEAARKYNGSAKSFEDIMRLICIALRVRKIDVMSDRRAADIVFARHAICYWARRLTTMSLPEIGRKLGRDHTTVIHGSMAYPARRKQMGRYLREVR